MKSNLYKDNKGYFYIKKVYHGSGKNDYTWKKNRIKMNKSILKYLSDNIFINLETKKKKKKKNKPKQKEPSPQEIKVIQDRKLIDDEYMANMQAAGRQFNPNVLNRGPIIEDVTENDNQDVVLPYRGEPQTFSIPSLNFSQRQADAVDRFLKRRENKRFGNDKSSSRDEKSSSSEQSSSEIEKPSSSNDEPEPEKSGLSNDEPEPEKLDMEGILHFKDITLLMSHKNFVGLNDNISVDTAINRLIKFDKIKKLLLVKTGKEKGQPRKNFNSDVRDNVLDEIKNSGLIAQINDDIKNGRGFSRGSGISNIDIEKGMKQMYAKHIKMKNFMGCFMSDELEYLPKNKKIFSFIINRDDSSKEGSHWIAVNVTPTSLEYFDPLSGNMIKGFKENIKKILRRNGIKNPLKLKINKVRDQRLSSDSCGYFSMKFLIDRNVKNKPFDVASGYKGIDVAEKAVGFFRKKFNKYI